MIVLVDLSRHHPHSSCKMKWYIFTFFDLATKLTLSDAYAWGTDRCGPPNHGSGVSTDSTGFSVTLDSHNTILLSSTNSFRGFFMKTDAGLIWSNPSAGTQVSSLCGGGNTAWFHSSGNGKSLVTATLSCANSPGTSFTVTVYVVFSYGSAYRSFTRALQCPASTSTTSTRSMSKLHDECNHYIF